MKVLGILSFLLDLILLNSLPFSFQNLSVLTPLLTVTFLSFYLYSFKKANTVYFFTLVLLLGIVINNNICLTLLLIGFLYWYIRKMHSFFKETFLSYFLIIFSSLVLYDIIFFLIVTILGPLDFHIEYLLYKIAHSLILNLIYAIILYLLNLVLKSKKG